MGSNLTGAAQLAIGGVTVGVPLEDKLQKRVVDIREALAAAKALGMTQTEKDRLSHLLWITRSYIVTEGGKIPAGVSADTWGDLTWSTREGEIFLEDAEVVADPPIRISMVFGALPPQTPEEAVEAGVEDVAPQIVYEGGDGASENNTNGDISFYQRHKTLVFVGGGVLILGLGALAFFSTRERNPSKDESEGWMRYYQAKEYADEGDWRHVELRLEEARIHAERLPEPEKAKLLDAIRSF